jgi:hypothetical protein
MEDSGEAAAFFVFFLFVAIGAKRSANVQF